MTINRRHLPQDNTRTRGFTLVEVLVSLVVLSIGLLGIAKLMLFSSHSNDSAYLRSQATGLAYQMLDNMRANMTQAIVVGGPYTTALTDTPPDPHMACVATAPCANLALYDVYQWKLRLNANSGVVPAGALPNGQGSVATALVGSATTATIIVQWDDSVAQNTLNPGATLTTQSIVLESVL